MSFNINNIKTCTEKFTEYTVSCFETPSTSLPPSSSSSSSSSESFEQYFPTVSYHFDLTSGIENTFVDYSQCFGNKNSSIGNSPVVCLSQTINSLMGTYMWGQAHQSAKEVSSEENNYEVDYKKAEAEFKKIKKEFCHLFANGNFTDTQDDFIGAIPNIGQDQVLIASVDEFTALGTSGLGPCLAICARGKDIHGKTYLGMLHSLQDPENALEYMTEAFISKGCVEDSLEFYVIGGWLSEDCLELEKEYLELTRSTSGSKAFNIKEVLFNLIKPDVDPMSSEGEMSVPVEVDLEAINVLLTPTQILYSRRPFFSSAEKFKNAGVFLGLSSKRLQSEFDFLKRFYGHLFNQGKFTETQQKYASRVPDVDQDKFLIASVDEFAALGTSGLAPCLAICARAKDAQGKVYLGLAHNSLQTADTVCEHMTNDFVAKGCLKDSIEFYVIGGWLNDAGLEMEKEFLLLANIGKYPIKEVLFNLNPAGDESKTIKVVLTSDQILYSRKPLFKALAGFENAGEYI